MNERKYIAISIKHSQHNWNFGESFTLWGWRRTSDEENRLYSGYTQYPTKAELYALGDFAKHGYDLDNIKDDEPVMITSDICKKYKNYDTVLVDEERLVLYYKLCGLNLYQTEDD